MPLLASRGDAGFVYTSYRWFGARAREFPAEPFDLGLFALRPFVVSSALIGGLPSTLSEGIAGRWPPRMRIGLVPGNGRAWLARHCAARAAIRLQDPPGKSE